jgi:glycosyltransferase involved in cell wall biosynthesis
MNRRDLSQYDASSYATSELEYVIRRKKKVSEPTVRRVSAQQAMTDSRVFKVSTQRDVTRVLFVSRDTDIINPTLEKLDGYIHLSKLFDEVHILILRQGIAPKNPVLRAADNVWIYTAFASFWWLTPAAGIRMVGEQLNFADGFRPDLIVARDPFESAIVVHKLGKKNNRVTQLHILEDYTNGDFIKKNQHNFWRRFLPRFTVPWFPSVRTMTNTVQTMLQKKFVIPDIDTLPRYHNYKALIDTKATVNLKEKYKQFAFVMLYVGKLGHESTLYRALDAARFALKNPRVGMVVLGDGPARREFEKRAKTLGIEQQVVFEPNLSDIVPYLKSANLMIVTDTDSDSEDLVLKGSAAGISMVISRTEKREDIFSHGESAFLCDATDVQAFTNSINDLLNNVNQRKQFATNGQAIIRDLFHNDKKEYQEAYRASIEQAFFIESDEEVEEAKKK